MRYLRLCSSVGGTMIFGFYLLYEVCYLPSLLP